MIPVNRILFPVDFSKMCVRAATHVRAMAKRLDAEVVLFNVVEPPTTNWYAYGGLAPVMVFMPPSPPQVSEAELQEWKRRKEERLASFLPELWDGLRVTRVVEEGYPAEAIITAVKERKIDLVMMPTHGDGPIRRFLLGSVTAKVLHDAPCPVWTDAHLISEEHATSVDIRKVLCALDLESKAAHLLVDAKEFADSQNMGFLETSAKARINVDESFMMLTRQVYDSLPESEKKREEEGSKLHSHRKKDSGGCCN